MQPNPVLAAQRQRVAAAATADPLQYAQQQGIYNQMQKALGATVTSGYAANSDTWTGTTGNFMASSSPITYTTTTTPSSTSYSTTGAIFQNK